MEKIRINKYLASLGIDSRRAIDKLVEQGKISVNGRTAESGIKVDFTDNITIDGKSVHKKKSEKIYYMVNKPKKVLSAVKDARGRKLVTELVKTDERIFPIGRLDYESEGLIILTNDGDMYNRVIHPRKELYKTYIVEVLGSVGMSAINKIQKGIILDGEVTLPARAKVTSSSNVKTVITVSIKEGRNRQVRRMFEEVGHKVVFLKRVSIGELILDEKLQVGDARPLRKKEVNYLNTL